MKLLLDTNILIDLVADRAPYAEDVRKLCIAAVFGDVQLWVSAQSYADAFCVLRKEASKRAVKNALLATLDMLLPCGTYASDLRAALESDWPDVEDYLIAASTKHIGADIIVTRDSEMRQRGPVPTMTAEAVLLKLQDERGLVYDDIAL